MAINRWPFFPRLRILPAALALAAICLAGATEAGERRHGQGRLWQVERDGGAPSHLFGTMHSSEASVATLPAPAARALDGSRGLVLELVLDAGVNLQMAQAMMLTDGRTLSGILGPERFARVGSAAGRYGMPAAALEALQPWAVAAILGLPPDELARQQSGQTPLDQVLQNRAKAAGKPVHGLESVAEQIAVFAGLGEADQIAMLDATLALAPEVERIFDDLKRAYLAGDLDALHAMAEAQQAGTDPELAVRIEDRLIDARNHRMAERLTPHLAKGGMFVAVGALHLSGDEGILHLLEQQGYRVTKVQ